MLSIPALEGWIRFYLAGNALLAVLVTDDELGGLADIFFSAVLKKRQVVVWSVCCAHPLSRDLIDTRLLKISLALIVTALQMSAILSGPHPSARLIQGRLDRPGARRHFRC